jgi:3',5'-cyclic-AMP phosphodiesterase
MRHARLWIALLAMLGLVAAANPASPPAHPAANDFRFAILGDRTGNAQPGVYEEIWREIDVEYPDFVVNVGDSIQGGQDSTAAPEWQALRQLWNGYRYPLYLVPGNHDIWSAASREVYEKQTGHPAFYSFNYQNAHFVVLDNSAAPDLSDSLPDDQMRFLERDLERNRDREPKFIFFHKPLWLVPVTLQNSRFAFHQLITKYGAVFVLSGHVHRYIRDRLDGVTYLAAPSSGGKLKGQGFDDGWFYGHVAVTVKAAHVEIVVKEIGPPWGQGRVITAGRSTAVPVP